MPWGDDDEAHSWQVCLPQNATEFPENLIKGWQHGHLLGESREPEHFTRGL